MNGLLARRRIRLRPLTVADGEVLDRVVAGLSPASRRSRYLADLDHLPAASRTALLDVDGVRHVAFVAEVRYRGEVVPIGIGRYVVDAPGAAEIAYEVVDAWQGRGVGRLLLRRLAEVARAAGLERFHATLLDDNVASMALLRKELAGVRVRREGGLLHVTALVGGAALTVDDVLQDLALTA